PSSLVSKEARANLVRTASGGTQINASRSVGAQTRAAMWRPLGVTGAGRLQSGSLERCHWRGVTGEVSLEGCADDLACFGLHLFEVVLAAEGLRVDLVDVFRARGARREPRRLRDDLQPTDRG